MLADQDRDFSKFHNKHVLSPAHCVSVSAVNLGETKLSDK